MTARPERFILFTLPKGRFALRLAEVAEVLEGVTSFRVPKGPRYLFEAVKAHGAIVPVLDLAAFSDPRAVTGGETVLVLDRRAANLALRVAAVDGIIPADELVGEESGDAMVERYLLLSGGRRVGLLSVETVLDMVEKTLE